MNGVPSPRVGSRTEHFTWISHPVDISTCPNILIEVFSSEWDLFFAQLLPPTASLDGVKLMSLWKCCTFPHHRVFHVVAVTKSILYIFPYYFQVRRSVVATRKIPRSIASLYWVNDICIPKMDIFKQAGYTFWKGMCLPFFYWIASLVLGPISCVMVMGGDTNEAQRFCGNGPWYHWAIQKVPLISISWAQ